MPRSRRSKRRAAPAREDKFQCQVVTLYQGGQYKLYTYRKYSDVRLVFAPEGMTAFFGGDPDNFNFPRYDLDCSFVRLYEDGKPVKTPDHLAWSTAPPKDGEPVFVAGQSGLDPAAFDGGAAGEPARPGTAGDPDPIFRAARPADPLHLGERRTCPHRQ